MENTNMEKTKGGVYRWIVLGVLVLSFTSSFLSRFIWAPLIPTASKELSFTMVQAGSLMSGYYFGYLFTQIPGGFLADKFKVKYMLFASVALVGISTFAMSYVTSYGVAYAIRFGGGLVSGVLIAFCTRIISDNFAPKERAIAFGILFTSTSVGSLLANQIGPRSLPAIGWTGAFKVAAFFIFAVAVLILIVIKEPKKAENAGASQVKFIEGLKNYFTNKQIMIISLAGFLYMALPAGYITWANKFITGPKPGGLSLSVAQAGLVVTVYSICSIIGSMSSGFIAKKFSINAKTFSRVIYILMGITVITFGMQTTFTGLIIASLAFGFVSNMAATHVTSWAINLGGNKYAATTSSIQNLIFQSSNVIFPIVIGSLIDRNTVDGVVMSYNSVWYLFAGLVFSAAIVISTASRKSAVDCMK